MAPDDLHDGNALIEARKAYLAEVQKLGSGARGNEQKRLMKAWQKIDAERRPLTADELEELAALEARWKVKHE